jgi:FKBP-type peptidyl-prolyl cis-trans isomerase FklB
MSDIELKTTEAIASYGIGLQMGQQLLAAFPGVVAEAGLRGLMDVIESQPPRVDGQEINNAFQVIQTRLKEQEAQNEESMAAEGVAFLEQNAIRDGVTVTTTGLQYEVITMGDGPKPSATDTVSTHYRGTLINGTEFDSSYSRNAPTEFPVNGVIAGWTEALQLMPVGSKWKLFIPHNLAYGPRGAGGAIGPYQALVFEIELLAIK